MPIIRLTGRLLRAYQIAYNHISLAHHAGDVTMCHGAAVMKGSRILGGGRNTMLRNVVRGDIFATLHAERSAIINAGFQSDGKDR